jgi:uncharacterized protein DUF6338
MDNDLGQKLIALLQFLLPGFLAAWVYYGLTPVPLPSQFERIIQALIFTLLVQPLAFVTKCLLLAVGRYWPLFQWSSTSDVTASVMSAFVLGLVFAAFANNDKFHALIRWLRVSRETSYPSEWFGAFSNNDSYVVLHLKNLNRIYGWPTIWPSEPNKGHFVLEQASWLDAENTETQITNVSQVLVPTSVVQLVEFVPLQERSQNGASTKSTATAAGSN